MLWYIDLGIVAANIFQHCYWNLETSHYLTTETNTSLNGRFHLVYYYQDPEHALDQEKQYVFNFSEESAEVYGILCVRDD